MNGEPGADAAKTVDLRSPLVREPQPLSPKARRFEARDPANGGQARTRPVINDPPKQSHLGSAALKALRYRTMTPPVSMARPVRAQTVLVSAYETTAADRVTAVELIAIPRSSDPRLSDLLGRCYTLRV